MINQFKYLNPYWIKTAFHSISNYGILFTLKLPLTYWFCKNEVRIEVPEYKHPIMLRKNGTDFRVFAEVILRKCYLHAYSRNCTSIIDAGANIGLATVYFANKFPQSQITAIEVDPENFKQLSLNTAEYHNITPINKALWNCHTKIQIANPTSKKTAIRVQDSQAHEKGGIETITILDLLRIHKNKVDIFKVDIEGAEKTAFQSVDINTLEAIELLIIELHDFMIPGCAHSFYSHICSVPFEQTQHGENLYIRFRKSDTSKIT